MLFFHISFNFNKYLLINYSIVRSGDAIYVRVGDYDLTRKYGSPGAQTLRVATTYIHHNHNSQTLDNDIALLKLYGQAELRDGVCLVNAFSSILCPVENNSYVILNLILRAAYVKTISKN